MHKRAHRIAGNSFLELISRGFEFFVGTVLVILAARYLGLEDFGEYAFLRSVGIILAPFMTFGSLRILIRDISTNREDAAVYIFTGLILNLIFGLIALLIAALIALIFSIESFDLRVSLLLALLSHLFMAMRQTITSVFISYEKMIYSTFINILSRALVLIFFLIVIYLDYGFLALFIALASANAIGLIAAAVTALSTLVKINNRLDMRHITHILSESYPVALSSFMTQGYTYISVFFLKFFQDITQVSLFQAPQRIIAPLIFLPRAILLASFPSITRLARNDGSFEDLRSVSHYAVKYLFMFTLPVCLFSFAYSSGIIRFFFGTEFLDAQYSFQILIWSLLPLFLNLYFDFAITAIKKQKILMVSNGISFLVSSLLSLVLVQEYGYIGVSWASLIACISLFTVNYYFITKYLGFIRLHDVAIKPVIASVIAYLVILFMGERGIFLSCSVSLGAYFLFLFLLRAFSRDEVKFIRRMARYD